MPEIPCHYLRTTLRRHGHHYEVGKVHAALRIAVRESQGEIELSRCRAIQSMKARREALGELGRSMRVSARAKQQVDFDQDRPRHHDIAPQTSKELSRELVSSAFTSIDG